jgi:hypothetical protein
MRQNPQSERCANCICHRRDEHLRDTESDMRGFARVFLLAGGGLLIIASRRIDNDGRMDGSFDRGRHGFISMFGLDLTGHEQRHDDMHDAGFHLGGALRETGNVNQDNGDGRLMMHDGSIDRGRHDITPMFATDSTGPTQQDSGIDRGRHDITTLFALDPDGQHHRQHDLGRLDDGFRHPSGAWTMTDHPLDIGTDDDAELAALVRFNSSIAATAGAGLLVTA